MQPQQSGSQSQHDLLLSALIAGGAFAVLAVLLLFTYCCRRCDNSTGNATNQQQFLLEIGDQGGDSEPGLDGGLDSTGFPHQLS